MTNIVSIYKHALDKAGTTIDVYEALSKIKNGFWKEQVLAARKIKDDKEAYSTAKRKLAGITWSGEFSQRKADCLTKYSGIICLDVDHINEIEAVKDTLFGDQYVHAIFISPGGDGLKILVKVDTTTPNHHLPQFNLLEAYFKKNYDITIDRSGKDVSRLCFVSYDDNLLINDEAKVFSYLRISFDRLVEYTNRKRTYMEGQRNDYIFLLSNNCNRAGLPSYEVIQFMCDSFDLSKDEIITTVNSAYKAILEHGKHSLDKLDKESRVKEKKEEKEEKEPAPKYQYEGGDFWRVTKFMDPKTGREKEDITLLHIQFIAFLVKQGFGLYRTNRNSNDYEIVRVVDNIVYPVTSLYIKKHVQEYAENVINDPRVQTMLMKGAKTYFGSDLLEHLPYLSINFLRDTAERGYIFFANVFVTITADTITAEPYTEMKGNIWISQRLQREFNLKTISKDTDFTCQYATFLALTALGDRLKHKDTQDDIMAEYKSKMLSIMSTIGYLLHGYKNPALAKAVIAVDAKISDVAEAHGGSGKSLFMKGIAEMVSVYRVDAQNFKFDAPFPFDGLAAHHRIIDFNDAGSRFDFTRTFAMITEDMLVNRKFLGALHFPYADFPKIYISTNFTLKGDGGSHRRRQQIIEFGDFFSAERTVKDYFSATFYSNDWDDAEWEKFYTFMLICMQVHFAEGLVDFPVTNYDQRRLLSSMPMEFLDYFEEVLLHRFGKQKGRINRDASLEEAYTEFEKSTPHLDVKQTSFTRWIKKTCELRKLPFNPHTGGERDRIQGKTYITIEIEAAELEVTEDTPSVDF